MTTILYEKFLNCQDHTLDNFWRSVFYSCAINKFPKGVKYDNNKNTLSVKYEKNRKVKIDIFHLQMDDSLKLFEKLIFIFKELLDIRSEYDISISKKEFDDFRKLNEIDLDIEWKKLKPKSLKNNILMAFVSKEIKSKNIDQRKLKKIYNQLQLGFLFKYLSNDDVVYEKGEIISINGFDFVEETKEYVFINKKNALYRIEKQIIKTNYFQQHFDRWLKEYKLNCI